MAKSPKKTAASEPPIIPRVGDKVKMKGSDFVRQISKVYTGGDEVDVEVPGTNLQWFRVRADTLTYVERQPCAKTSNPFTTPEPTLDAAAVLERIDMTLAAFANWGVPLKCSAICTLSGHRFHFGH